MERLFITTAAMLLLTIINVIVNPVESIKQGYYEVYDQHNMYREMVYVKRGQSLPPKVYSTVVNKEVSIANAVGSYDQQPWSLVSRIASMYKLCSAGDLLR